MNHTINCIIKCNDNDNLNFKVDNKLFMAQQQNFQCINIKLIGLSHYLLYNTKYNDEPTLLLFLFIVY